MLKQELIDQGIILDIKDLHITYRTDEAIVYAVNGLNLRVKRGETLGLVGETGAGKTTTAISVLRLLPDRVGKVTQGEIWLDGENVMELSEPSIRQMRGDTVSMIFQDPMTSLNPLFTVGEQIAEVLEVHGKYKTKEEIDKRVDELMDMVGLPAERKKEYPHQFSGGMKQRIVIAIALACEPKLLLADEPTTALDVTIQAQVLELMHNLKEKYNTAMVLITHDLGVVAENCDRVAVMYAGEVIESGTVDEIFDSEQHHPYTVGLFGSIPDIDSPAPRLKPIDGLTPDPTVQQVGCPFAARCPHVTELCRTTKPKERMENTHMIKCHLFENYGKEVAYEHSAD